MQYNSDKKNLINSKNSLKFNVSHNTQKEFITLRLEDILTSKKFETVDSRIRNFSILVTKKRTWN